MKHGDIVIAWGRVTFIYDSELPGNFLKAVDFSTSTYLETGVFAQDQMYHKSVCRAATAIEKQDYNNTLEHSKYKQYILQTELI
ncbi:MAG TPA: hypothetical protein PK605_00280 [Ignavibacteria bacterium]|nr:hypothetical protein [Bacteroidota bacterium]HRE10783.1 hypothetical protein [Ignavibacteria bacterium]HRF65974.1 hypothetical protein [Ignavibacteria bacterium]HRJ02815.1 hypothetical protein [Ignavibacteria bacterium]HRJ84373.1 hypothetical protein [Ignavibacteria bacterium]